MSGRLHRKLGFQQEGRLRETVYTNGLYHDEFVLGITAGEFAEWQAPDGSREKA